MSDFDDFWEWFYDPPEYNISQQTKDLTFMLMSYLEEVREKRSLPPGGKTVREEVRKLIDKALGKEGHLPPVLSRPWTKEEERLLVEASIREGQERVAMLQEIEELPMKRDMLESREFWEMMGDQPMEVMDAEEDEEESEPEGEEEEDCELPSSGEDNPELTTKELSLTLDDQGLSDIGLDEIAEMTAPHLLFSMNFHVFAEYEPKGDNDEP